MIDVPDEDLIQHMLRRESAMEKFGRDQNYEEFKTQYAKHIEGKMDPSVRIGERPSTTPYDANKAKMRSTRMSMMGQSTQADTERGRSVMRNTWQGDDDDLDSQPRYQIPATCKLEILKLNKVDKLDEDYILAAHPYPQLDGEMIMFQQFPGDGEDKSCYIYRDYSLRKRFLTFYPDKQLNPLQAKKAHEEDISRTKLHCLEIDVANPLSTIDWQNLSAVIKEVDAMAWAQVLPVGQKASTPFQFNCMHILPSAKIPFKKVPLDLMITNKLNFVKKN